MIPKEAVKKAIEKGWKNYLPFTKRRKETLDQWIAFDLDNDWQQIALDPTFWYHLKKAINNNKCTCKTPSQAKYGHHISCNAYFPHWERVAHDFLHLILKRNDTKQFWNEILKNI